MSAVTTPSLGRAVRPFFDLGVAIDLRDLVAGPREVIAHQFTSVTAENAMKPAWIQPTEGRFEFEAADAIVAAARAHGQRVYGHTLFWHHQTPAWWFHHPDGTPLTNAPGDRRLLLDRAATHAGTLIEHFGDDVWAWEVVNEAVDETEPDLMRRTPWRRILGPSYVEQLLHLTRSVAPRATLVVNEFETEGPRKLHAYATLVRGLLDRGAPLDATGHQCHLTLETSVPQLELAIEHMAQLGVDQVITELDVSISRDPQESLALPPADRMAEQESFYDELFSMLLRHADSLRAVTLWGVGDGHSWLRYWPTIRLHEAPLLFDDLLRPKPAFWRALDAARSAQASAV